jgi:hypothetical protein
MSEMSLFDFPRGKKERKVVLSHHLYFPILMIKMAIKDRHLYAH